jgi:hypothetical protein
MGQVLDCSKCCTNADEENQEINDDNGAKRISQQPNYVDTTKSTRYSDYGAKTAAQKVINPFFQSFWGCYFLRRRRFF